MQRALLALSVWFAATATVASPRQPRDDIIGAPPAFVGGAKNPQDGTEIACDLPTQFHTQNTSSWGAGLCVFTSIHHSAIWQGVPALVDFPKWIREKSIPGGGHPSKVADLIPRIAKERGYPVPDYLQVQNTDLEILKLACRTGRMPAVTYGRSPTGRYGGGGISHMVSLVHADDRWFVVLDNNYVKPSGQAFEWMSPEQFLKVSYGNPGWSVILLAPPPPPPPIN